ncbi:MAG: hypothetical protein RAO92_06580 [Candidatus Euphemobacter frigidus]|nr:hypothetical protein [Candidatus Euphemobacter frigidus]MDP8276052.1 hypothetical protein [Candidatus Euphemobacter frigidus]
MSWRIGEWIIYTEGEVHQVLKRCLNYLWENGYSTSIKLPGGDTELKSNPAGLFDFLQAYEKEKGIAQLLSLLFKGLKINIECHKARAFEIRLIMSTPEDSEDRKTLFKDVICSWVEKDELSFSQRFFRFPKMSEDFLYKFLENPLEKVLKKTFGFHFKYKVILRCRGEVDELEPVRKSLCEILYSRNLN